MVKRQAFHSNKAPQPDGPYSQAIIHNEILYVFGQGPVESATAKIILAGLFDTAESTIYAEFLVN